MRINTSPRRLYLVDKTDLFSSFKILDYLIPNDLQPFYQALINIYSYNLMLEKFCCLNYNIYLCHR